MTKYKTNIKENIGTVDKKQKEAIINMVVKDDEIFLSVFSETETPVISNEVADFIETSAKAIPPNTKITLKIKSDCIDDNEKLIYKRAIKEYYREQCFANKAEINKNNLIAVLLMLAGVFVLALAFLLEYKASISFWAEIIDIIAWVFVWEAVDIFCFRTRALRIKTKQYLAFITMDIEYLPFKK